MPTEDTRAAVCRMLLRQAEIVAEMQLTSEGRAERQAEAEALRWLMQRAGVPLEEQTELDAG